MRGQLVVIKEFNGNLLVGRLWEISTYTAFIHSEEEWNKRMSGEKSLDPVGFPIEDVFIYDDYAKGELERTIPDSRNLRPVTALLESHLGTICVK
jgi:hypothetical protein